MSPLQTVAVRSIKLAAGQMLVEPGQAEANLQRAARCIAEAGRSGCDLVVLPECLDLGWTHPSAHDQAEPIPGPRCRHLAEAAAAADVCVVAGLTERWQDRIYNSAVVIDSAGNLLWTHRKINVMNIAQDLYSIGDRLRVAATTAGVIGVTICADNFPNALDLGRSLGRMGAQLVASPSAWAVDSDHDNAREPYGGLWREAYLPLAREFAMPIVGVSNVGPITAGPWAGRKCIGCSLIVDGQGQEVASGPYGEEALVVAALELAGHRPRGTDISGAY
jgi:predicted amidohydrolase